MVVVVVFFQVNEYMIFTVRASAWVDKIYYLICSKGNIVVGNTLEMASTQKTFSVALSREMVPSARIVAYYILNGEVVSDALNFHVNGTSLNPVEVRLITQSVFWKCIGFDTVNGIQRCIHTDRERTQALLHVKSAFAWTSNIENGFYGNKRWCSHLTFNFSRKGQIKEKRKYRRYV